jgi:RNA exonuclease 4
MMGRPFFTKKQKAKMRERRQKKKKLVAVVTKGDDDDDVNSMDAAIQKDTASSAATGETNDKLSIIETDEPSTSVSKKRPRESIDDTDGAQHPNGTLDKNSMAVANQSVTSGLTTKQMNGKLLVLMPSDLSTKDAKKFRKDARRKLREHHQGTHTTTKEEEEPIEFVTREEMPSLAHASKRQKKSSKEFPSIKELLKQQQQLQQLQKEEQKLKDKLNQIPEDVRQKYVAMDCEMVGIGSDGRKSALARVSLVDWNHEVVLDTFVQVPIRVTDFRTHVSGVEPKHIKHQSAMDVQKCRTLVAKLLKDKILVGHALTNDLKALMLAHPKDKIRDTAKYRPFQRYGNGKWRARKLRDLVKENLKGKEGFQEGEHDSVQDAKATMELFQLVFTSWEKELASKSK